MKPYSPDTKKGLTVAYDDVFKKTADQPKRQQRKASKPLKHSARQYGKKESNNGQR